MSLQFIMGPSGAGKSHYLYEWVTKEAWNYPEKNYIVLVPEQFTMQTQKDLVSASPRKGILNVEVLSFHRLAQRVLEETGENTRMILNDVGKNFVIRKVAGDNEEKFKVLGNQLKKMGYISEVKSIISEFTQYDIQPETLDAMLEKAEKSPGLYYKLCDIRTIYEGFQDFLKEKYITGEEVLDVLALVAHKSKLLKDSVVVLDGFTGFTPVQNKLLSELLRVCEEVKVSVTMDRRENPFVYQHPYQLFALSKQMVTSLVKIARECGVEVKEPVYLYEQPVYRFKENEPLAFLESHLFRYSNAVYRKEQDCVQVWCARNPKQEVDFVAQRIRHLVRTKNYRYRDIAVLTNDIKAYANCIEQVFEKYDLPVFMDHKRSILLNACVEYIRSLLAMAEQNFTYESVFRYLRTGLVCISREETDILENYVVALGIRGYKRWQEKWIRRTGGMDEEALAEVNRIRELFINSVDEVIQVLKGRSKTVQDVTRALHDFLLKEELQKRVKEYQTLFENEGELALEKEYAQVYRIIIELLDQFVELLGEEKISLKEYCELLDAGLEEAKVGIIPPSLDQVVVGDVERSRIKDVKVVFLIGVNENYIPGDVKGSGLLSEYDRQLITESGATLAPGVKEKTYIQKFYLYLTLTKPTNQVYLTYSKCGADGKSLRPSYLISDVCKLFEKLQVQEISGKLKDRELTAESGVTCLVEGLQRKREGLSPEWQELYTWYQKHPQWSKKVKQIVEAAFSEKKESTLTRETAKKLYGDILENSVSRLEKFSACAYAHFLTYGLRLRKREEYQFSAIDMGTLFHGAIEKFSYKLEKSGYTWLEIPENVQDTLIEESVDECIVDYGNSILYSTARNEYIIIRLKRMLRRTVWALKEQMKESAFVPKGYEIKFSQELGSMRLLGKIDRVDLKEENDQVHVKIVDYKTGKAKFDLGELCYGLQMQLIVYMNVALEMQKKKHPDKEVVPAGLFYYRMQDPIIAKKDVVTTVEDAILKELQLDGAAVEEAEEGKKRKALSPEEFRIVSEFANAKVQEIGAKILEGKAEIAPYSLENKDGCANCPYQAVCGYDERIAGYEHRKLEKLSREEALEKMEKEVRSCQ